MFPKVWSRIRARRWVSFPLEDFSTGYLRALASVFRDHRPVVRGRFTVQNQDPAFAEIEFGMSGLGFHRGAVLSFVSLRLSGQAFGSL